MPHVFWRTQGHPGGHTAKRTPTESVRQIKAQWRVFLLMANGVVAKSYLMRHRLGANSTTWNVLVALHLGHSTTMTGDRG